MRDLGGVVAVECLNSYEQRFQLRCSDFDQKLHFLGIFNQAFLAVARLNRLKAGQLLCECRGCLLLSLRH